MTHTSPISPVTGHYIDVAPGKPALSLGLELRPSAVASLLLQMPRQPSRASGVSAVAITAGASAGAGTTGGAAAGASGTKNAATTAGTQYHQGMAVFTVAKGGLMYEAAIGGQKFKYESI